MKQQKKSALSAEGSGENIREEDNMSLNRISDDEQEANQAQSNKKNASHGKNRGKRSPTKPAPPLTNRQIKRLNKIEQQRTEARALQAAQQAAAAAAKACNTATMAAVLAAAGSGEIDPEELAAAVSKADLEAACAAQAAQEEHLAARPPQPRRKPSLEPTPAKIYRSTMVSAARGDLTEQEQLLQVAKKDRAALKAQMLANARFMSRQEAREKNMLEVALFGGNKAEQRVLAVMRRAPSLPLPTNGVDNRVVCAARAASLPISSSKVVGDLLAPAAAAESEAEASQVAAPAAATQGPQSVSTQPATAAPAAAAAAATMGAEGQMAAVEQRGRSAEPGERRRRRGRPRNAARTEGVMHLLATAAAAAATAAAEGEAPEPQASTAAAGTVSSDTLGGQLATPTAAAAAVGSTQETLMVPSAVDSSSQVILAGATTTTTTTSSRPLSSTKESRKNKPKGLQYLRHVVCHTVPKKAGRAVAAVQAAGREVVEVAEAVCSSLRIGSSSSSSQQAKAVASPTSATQADVVVTVDVTLVAAKGSSSSSTQEVLQAAKGWFSKLGHSCKSLFVCGSSHQPVEEVAGC